MTLRSRAGVDRIALGRFAVVPRLADLARIDAPVGPQQLEQVVAMVLALRLRDLGDERLRGERMLDVVHRPQPADPRVRGRLRVLDAHVRNLVRQPGEAQSELERREGLRVGGEDRDDRRLRRPVQPRDHLAVGIEPGFQVLRRHRMEVVVVQVVLAGPRHLDRRAAHLLRCQRGLDDEVGLRLAAEPAAQQRDVDRHLVGRQVQTAWRPGRALPAATGWAPRPRTRR